MHALDDLPTDDLTITAEIRERAELHLIGLADDFAPTQLRRLARKVLEVIAPEISDEAERKALEREEQLAAERTRLTLTPLGDGTTRISGRISDAAAGRLRTYLEAFASPRRTATERRRTHPHPTAARPRAHRPPRSLPAEVLPAHGGTATTVTVHLDLDQLTAEPREGRHRHPGDRRRHHRRPSPAARLPGQDPARRPRREVRSPRPRPHPPAALRRPTQSHPAPAHPVPGRRLHRPRRLVRDPPPPRLVHRREDRPRQRRPPLQPPPPPSPRHPLPHQPAAQRRLPLHQADIGRRMAGGRQPCYAFFSTR